jgi:NDP-sugar pyrophosphorylase family protein
MGVTVNYGVRQYIEAWATSLFADIDLAPWQIVQHAEELIREALTRLDSVYRINSEFAVHKSSTIEAGVVLKGPGIIGPRCFVAAGSYLRGGTYLGEDCIVGPSSELKTSFMFPGSKIAHLNFVGDSLIGSGVNIEAGAIIANYRNEFADKTIRILHEGEAIDTGVTKFGSLIGDNARIGANAVVAPGALIAPGSKVGRLQLLDQYPY